MACRFTLPMRELRFVLPIFASEPAWSSARFMIHRVLLARFVLPFIALGAITFGMSRVSAGEVASRSVASSARPRPATRRVAPKSVLAAKPAPVSASVPVQVLPANAETASAQKMSAAPAVRQAFSADMAWGQVNAQNVNVRTGPSTQNGVVITLKGGEYVKAKASHGAWLEIEWPQAMPTWVFKSAITVNAEKGAFVSAASARVFSNGNTQSTVVAKLDKGAAVVIVGEEGSWFKIKAPESASAYISSKFVLTGVEAPMPKMAAAPLSASISAALPTKIFAAPAAPAPAPRNKNPEQQAVIKEALINTIEDTRKKLKAPSIDKSAAAGSDPDASTARLAKENEQRLMAEETQRKAAEEQARVDTEVRKKAEAAEAEEQSKRDAAEAEALRATEAAKKKFDIEQVRVETEAKKKAEAEVTARREADEIRRLAEETKRKAADELQRVETEARKKADAEEQARRESEARRMEEIELGRRESAAKIKAEIEEQTRRATEARRAEEIESARLATEAKMKAEANEQARRIAAEVQAKKDAETAAKAQAETEQQAKRAAVEMQAIKDAEIAKKARDAEQTRIETEARRMTEAEDLARRDAEFKRLKEIESARAVTARQKAEAQETQRKAELEKQPKREESEARGGLFIDPADVKKMPALPTETPPAPEIEQSRSGLQLPSPKRRVGMAESSEPAPTKVAYSPWAGAADAAAIKPENDADMPIDGRPIPDAVKRVKSKFILPRHAPSIPGHRAEVVELSESATSSPEAVAAPVSRLSAVILDDVPAQPATPLLRPESPVIAPAQTDLPEPTSAAPASQRLQPHFEAQAGSVKGAGPVVTAEGTVELCSLSPVAGADYALVRDGRTLHVLSAAQSLGLESYIGRRVSITGVPLQGVQSAQAVLEVSSVTARD